MEITLHHNFFGVNLDSLKTSIYKDHLKVAINSCRMNTNLKTWCLYTGEKSDMYDWLLSKNVTMLDCNQTLLVDNINRDKSDTFNHGIAKGAWLRVEIPNIVRSLDINPTHVLYTDVDVIFTDKWNPVMLTTDGIPRFACSFEGDAQQHYNTGVMVMNVEYMQNTYSSFMEYVYNTGIATFNPYDQAALNNFYPVNTITRLQRRYWNWTPYMDNGTLSDSQARIKHFHGPKLNFIRSKGSCMPIDVNPLHQLIHQLYNQSPQKYEEMLSLADVYLHD